MSLVKVRLAAMMFLEYFIWGAWYVTVGTWLGRTRHFTGSEIALVGGTTAVAAIVSPFIVGWLADRFFATQHVIAVLHLAGAVLLWVASSQTTFGAIYWLILAYACLYMPTLALTNSLAFRQMKDPKLEFGPIRVLGTAGWIVAGLIISHLNWEVTAFPLKLAAVCSAVFAAYALTLPHTPPLKRDEFKAASVIPPEAVQLLKDKSFFIFVLASFLICIPLQFYYVFTNLFLTEIGVSNTAGKMAMGQGSELLCMLFIAWFFRRLGVKYMLIAGMSAWALRYVLFALGRLDAVSRHPAPRHLLRLLFCHRPNLCRPQGSACLPRRRTGHDHPHHIRRRHVRRLLLIWLGRRPLRHRGGRRQRNARLAAHLAR